MYLIRSPLQDRHVQKDFTKFANQRFLKTVNWEVLGRLLAKHAEGLPKLDLSVLAANPTEGRKQISDFLLGPRDDYPETLIHDLHRIVRLDSAQGMQLIVPAQSFAWRDSGVVSITAAATRGRPGRAGSQ